MCAHPGKDCKTPSYGHQKDAVWCNKISFIERNCTWQVGPIPANKTNLEKLNNIIHLNYYVSLLQTHRNMQQYLQKLTVACQVTTGKMNTWQSLPM